MKSVLPYLFSGFIFLISACEKQEEIFVSPDLQEYFDRFAIEAGQRGITFDYEASRIEGYINDVVERGVSGKCVFNSELPDQVYIDLAFWNAASDLEKEFVVFHELGHCFLQREHLDSTKPDGSCLSMMHSGLGGCDNAYSRSNRTAYLDELFSEF